MSYASSRGFSTQSYACGKSDRDLEYVRFIDLLEQTLLLNANKTAFISQYENISKTYGDIKGDVNKIVLQIHALGLNRGDVAGIWSCNSYSWVPIVYACSKLGIVLCPINQAYKYKELANVLKLAQIKLLFMPGLNSSQDHVNEYHVVLLEALNWTDINDDDDQIILQHIISICGQGFKITHDKYTIRTHILYKATVHYTDNILDISSAQVSPEDPAFILFTSGTTGKPKAACLSQFSLVNNVIQTCRTFSNHTKTLCCPVPFYHSMGLHAIIAMCVYPTKLVITNCMHSNSQLVNTLTRFKCTDMFATPFMVSDMLSYLEINRVCLPDLYGITMVGSPVSNELATRIPLVLPRCTGARVCYGTTETSSFQCISNYIDCSYFRLETIGRPIGHTEIKIVNPSTGRVVKIGEQGELLTRGFSQMLYYWRDETKTREVIDNNGWYITGDMAIMDEHGYLKICGRINDMIIVGGENVYPQEVEDVLRKHYMVNDAYVIGVPDNKKGEEICAWIRLNQLDHMPKENALRLFCEHRMAKYKVPRYIMFVDTFPVSSTGKVQKYLMREQSCRILGLKL